jgi:predicted negative regulator of RcsB-dependent stress response
MQKGVDEHRGIARLRLAAVLLEEKKYADGAQDPRRQQGRGVRRARGGPSRRHHAVAGPHRRGARRVQDASEKADARNPVKQIAETKLNALGGAQ